MSTTPYRSIGVTVKVRFEEKEAVLAPIMNILRASGATVYIDPHAASGLPCTQDAPLITDAAALDLLIIVGGDGTVLRAVREWKPGKVPMLAINAGSVGFLSALPLADVSERLPAFLAGGGLIEHRSSLHADVLRGDTSVFQCVALNDVVISQGTISRLLDVNATIDGQFLTTYHADGLIVATPTGSTAYSLAAGGPVVHPAVSALILTPINPHGFTQKPIVLPGDASIDVSVAGDVPFHANATVGLTVDGQTYTELLPGDRVTVRMSGDVHFLRSDADSFYRALRTKLKWGEGLDD